MVSVPMPHDLFAVTAGSVRPQRSSLDQCVDTILAPARSDSPDDVATLVAEVVLVALPLAESLARRYHGRGVEPEDLLQVARLGLVKAAQRYRPESPGGFSAYAIPTITGEIKRHFRDHQWLVRPPRAIQDLRRRVSDCRGALSQALGRTVTDAEIARELGIDADLVRAVVLAGGAYGATSDEALAEHPVRERGFDQVLGCLTMQSLLNRLDERDARLFLLRFVEGRSQSAIAADLGVSQMQVSRLLGRLATRIRGELGAHHPAD